LLLPGFKPRFVNFGTPFVNSVRALLIYRMGYYTGVNVAAQVHPTAKEFRWEDLGVELFDLEGGSDDLR
jgi:hypothetical protein